MNEPTMDSVVARALLPTLGAAIAGKCGFFRVSANNPNGLLEIAVCAMDVEAWRRFVEPALLAAKVPTVEVGRG